MRAVPLVLVIPEDAYAKFMALIEPQLSAFLTDPSEEAAATREWAAECG